MQTETTQQPPQQNQQQMVSLSFSSQMSKEDEEMARSALSAFRAKEDEIEKRKLEVRERVKAQLGHVEEETRHLANIREALGLGHLILVVGFASFVLRQGSKFVKMIMILFHELESMADPMRKEVNWVRKKIDSVNKELKPLGSTAKKKEREYKEALDTFNEKNREKFPSIMNIEMVLIRHNRHLKTLVAPRLTGSVLIAVQAARERAENLGLCCSVENSRIIC